MESDYEVIKVRRDLIPAGAKLVEAYETEREIIVCGDPPPEPEGLSDEEYAAYYEASHNCDAMGCGTLSHVLYRFDKAAADERLRLAVEALRDVENPMLKFRRELPEGHVLDGMGCVMLMDSPQTYKDIAEAALEKIGEAV